MILRLHLGRWLVLLACWLQAVNLHRTSFQGLRPVRTTGQASERDHRCGTSCPGRASWPALDDHVYAPTRKPALLNKLGIAPKLRQNRFNCNRHLAMSASANIFISIDSKNFDTLWRSVGRTLSGFRRPRSLSSTNRSTKRLDDHGRAGGNMINDNRPRTTSAALSRSTVPRAASPPSPAPIASQPLFEIDGLQHGLVPIADDVRLHYVVAGEGEPVLLIPGWPQSWYAWRFVIRLLKDAGRRVYAVDPRGFGDSDKPDQGYDLETVSHDIHVFLDQLGLLGAGGVDIISHDVGTWIGHAHAANYPNDVRRLVVTDATIPGVSPPPPAGYPDRLRNARSWHFGFNRIDGLPEALIHGREREFLTWFFGPFKCTRTWTIDADAFEE